MISKYLEFGAFSFLFFFSFLFGQRVYFFTCKKKKKNKQTNKKKKKTALEEIISITQAKR
jgi:hypothetical protein